MSLLKRLLSRRPAKPTVLEARAAAMVILGFALIGLTYGLLGAVVSELFPTPVRYTGSSLAFILAGIKAGIGLLTSKRVGQNRGGHSAAFRIYQAMLSQMKF